MMIALSRIDSNCIPMIGEEGIWALEFRMSGGVNVQQRLRIGISHLRSGRLMEAKKVYREDWLLPAFSDATGASMPVRPAIDAIVAMNSAGSTGLET